VSSYYLLIAILCPQKILAVKSQLHQPLAFPYSVNTGILITPDEVIPRSLIFYRS